MRQNRKHILLVDDDINLLRSLEFILVRKDLQVTTAIDGREAVAKFHAASYEENPVDLVISDIRMPGLSGMDLLDKIDGNIPKIIITAVGNKTLNEELSKRGCNHCIEKPFGEDEILGCVFHLLHLNPALQ